MAPRKSLLVAAALAGAALAASRPPAAHGEGELLDYALVQRTLPRLQELGTESSTHMQRMHELVEVLEKGQQTTPERKATQTAIKAAVESYMRTKEEMKTVLRKVLRIEASPQTDREIMDVLHNTELNGIAWQDASFRKCMKDLSGALGIRIRMAYHVVQMNQVTMQFRSAQASTVLGSLCNYFELRYVIQDGEVVVFKKLTPNEERFLEYEAKHPGVKLKYWEREDASGEYKKETK